jgi:ABC-type transport system involved in cytochrome bd biosynthesis fused ATPase/permease subunit
MYNISTVFAEELAYEIAKIPEKYRPNLLQIVRLFRESVASNLESNSQDVSLFEAIEDLGLIRAMQEVKDETPLNLKEALAELETL